MGKPVPAALGDGLVAFLGGKFVEKCDCYPHGPKEACTCEGCWACLGNVIGCTCDINWDCEHRNV